MICQQPDHNAEIVRQGGYNRLRCPKCGTVRQINARLARRYFENGWPRCCGETMFLHREVDDV